MQNPRLEHLSPARVEELWPQIKELVCRVKDDGNFLYAPVPPNYIYMTAKANVSHILGFFDSHRLCMILVFELTPSEKGKVANILSLAGKNLMKFKQLYWADILAWFKEAGAVGVSASADHRLANIYLRKFGFTHICSHVSMKL